MPVLNFKQDKKDEAKAGETQQAAQPEQPKTVEVQLGEQKQRGPEVYREGPFQGKLKSLSKELGGSPREIEYDPDSGQVIAFRVERSEKDSILSPAQAKWQRDKKEDGTLSDTFSIEGRAAKFKVDDKFRVTSYHTDSFRYDILEFKENSTEVNKYQRFSKDDGITRTYTRRGESDIWDVQASKGTVRYANSTFQGKVEFTLTGEFRYQVPDAKNDPNKTLWQIRRDDGSTVAEYLLPSLTERILPEGKRITHYATGAEKEVTFINPRNVNAGVQVSRVKHPDGMEYIPKYDSKGAMQEVRARNTKSGSEIIWTRGSDSLWRADKPGFKERGVSPLSADGAYQYTAADGTTDRHFIDGSRQQITRERVQIFINPAGQIDRTLYGRREQKYTYDGAGKFLQLVEKNKGKEQVWIPPAGSSDATVLPNGDVSWVTDKGQKEFRQASLSVVVKEGGEVRSVKLPDGSSREFERNATGLYAIVDHRMTRKGIVEQTWSRQNDREGRPTATFALNTPPNPYQKAATTDELGRVLTIEFAPRLDRKRLEEQTITVGKVSLEYDGDTSRIASVTIRDSPDIVRSREEPQRILRMYGSIVDLAADGKPTGGTKYIERTFLYEGEKLVGFEDKDLKAQKKLVEQWKAPEGAENISVQANGDVTYEIEKDVDGEKKRVKETKQADLTLEITEKRSGKSNRWDKILAGTPIDGSAWFGEYKITDSGNLAVARYSKEAWDKGEARRAKVKAAGGDPSQPEEIDLITYQHEASDNRWHIYLPDGKTRLQEQVGTNNLRVRREVKVLENGDYEFAYNGRTMLSRASGIHRSPGESYESLSLLEARERLLEIATESFDKFKPRNESITPDERLRRLETYMVTLEKRMLVTGKLNEKANDGGRVSGIDKQLPTTVEERVEQVIRTYDHFAELMETPEVAGQMFNEEWRVALAEQGMFHLHQPMFIDQGGNPTCQTNVIEGYGASQEPDVLMAFAKEIALRSRTITRTGETYPAPSAAILPGAEETRFSLANATETGTRSAFSKLMQGGIINLYRSKHNLGAYERGAPWGGGFSIAGASTLWLGYPIPDGRRDADELIKRGRGPVAQTTLGGAHIQLVFGVPKGDSLEDMTIAAITLENSWGNDSREEIAAINKIQDPKLREAFLKSKDTPFGSSKFLKLYEGVDETLFH